MDTLPPKAERGHDLQATRVSREPPNELVKPHSSRRSYGPGDVIDGKYALVALLGRGGMGEVWTARNATLDVLRAIKLIRADAGSPDSTDRLLYEAQAAARLAEPAIVRVFDFGKTASGDPYIVMEMLEGEDLMGIIRRRERLSPIKAVRALLPVIRALAGAHAHGIVHRDLKPENIFLSKLPDGRVQPKLLDFGIAKLKNSIGLRLTTDGAVLGSPLYMSPEQARGEDVDERADIWALTVVLYETITGNPPFSGDDRAAVTRAVAEENPPRLSRHNVSDDSLWPILSRGLMKQRTDRWSSMEELGRELARWLLDRGVIDDITGASLQTGWFRNSRQSLFGSSSPPLRASLAGPSEPPSLRLVGVRTPLPARLRGFARSLATRARSLAAHAVAGAPWLSAAGPQRRWAVGAALFGVLVGIAIAVKTLSEPDGVAAPSPAELATPDPLPGSSEGAPAAIDGASASSGEIGAASALEGEAASTPADGATTDPEARPAPNTARARPGEPGRAAATDTNRGRRKPGAQDGARPGESKAHRRSKLIDPYR